MISLKKGFLFIHIPKTGGNSIQNILRRYSEDKFVTVSSIQDGKERFEIRNDRYDINKHSTLNEYKKVIEPKIFSGLYKFATIRNPYDRLISFYFSPHLGNKEWDRDKFILLINDVLPVRNFISIENYKVKINRKLKFNIFSPNSLDTDIDFLIKYESLDEDFKNVCKALSIPYQPLPHRNKSERKHYSKYYDEELKQLVYSRFKEEIEFGGYTY